MRQINEFDQLTGLTKKVTLIKVIETDKNGKQYPREMNLRHALQACKVQPKRYQLAEDLPKGISLNMVPPGTTMKDVREFEKIRGTVGKVQKTQFDNVLDAIENGLELVDVEVVDADPNAEAGAMMDENAPPGFKPEGVDLEPAEGMKDPEVISDGIKISGTEEKALDEKVNQEPALKELKEKELKFEEQGAAATKGYTKQEIKDFSKDKLQAILVKLPAFIKMSEKMQKTVLKANKAPLIDTIVQLSKKK
jgi:hypothetical protein